jgi:hypothetical protein
MRAIILSALVLAGMFGSGVASSQVGGEKGPLLNVTALVAQLETRPGPWIGRSATLRGIVEPCPWWDRAAQRRYCAGEPLVLAATRGTSVLPVVHSTEPGWLRRARGISLLGALLPSSPALPLFTPLRVTVQLERMPAASCGLSVCVRARLPYSAWRRLSA